MNLLIHKMYMEIAEHIAETLSKDTKKKVCALAVKDDSILGYGYNGTPSGWESNEIPLYEGRTLHDYVVHAEINLIAKMAKKGTATNNATLYVNYAPCADCAKAIRQAGFKCLVYKNDYKSHVGLAVLTVGNHSTLEVLKIGA